MAPAFDGANGVISTATILNGMSVNLPASTAWPTANLALFIPFRLAEPVTVYKLATGSGATAAGNFDIGIYDAAGNRMVSSGATAKGASVEHIADVTDTRLGPGLYYLAMSADGTNNYIMQTATSIPIQKSRMLGIVSMATAYVLPLTATFAAVGVGAIPMLAAYLRRF